MMSYAMAATQSVAFQSTVWTAANEVSNQAKDHHAVYRLDALAS